MSKHLCVAILLAILIAPMAMADQVVLKNGERLIGSIVKSDGKALTIKSEFAGIVSVPLDAVTEITADQPIYLTLKDGQILVGTVGAADGKLAVKTSDAGTITIAKDSIQDRTFQGRTSSLPDSARAAAQPKPGRPLER